MPHGPIERSKLAIKGVANRDRPVVAKRRDISRVGSSEKGRVEVPKCSVHPDIPMS